MNRERQKPWDRTAPMGLGALKAGSKQTAPLVGLGQLTGCWASRQAQRSPRSSLQLQPPFFPVSFPQQEVAQNGDSALGNQAFMSRLFQISSKHVHHPLHAFFSVDASDGFVVEPAVLKCGTLESSVTSVCQLWPNHHSLAWETLVKKSFGRNSLYCFLQSYRI